MNKFSLALWFLALVMSCIGAHGADRPDHDAYDIQALQRASDACLGIEVRSIGDVLPAETPGAPLKGTGVVIGADGLVLTIGHLLLEAEEVDLVLDDGRRIPAQPLAYDAASGLGLVRSLLPLLLSPVPLGMAAGIGAEDLLLFVSGGSAGAVGTTRLLLRQRFAGSWEYLIEDALFVAPARPDHSGAGLFNRHGELVGIGSLLLRELSPAETREGTRRPSNMFVPVDLLKPILAELLSTGQVQANRRAWLGVSSTADESGLRVLRVSRDSPAERAGVLPGDHILSLDGQRVHDQAGFYQQLWGGGAVERDIRLDIRRDGRLYQLQLRSTDHLATFRRAPGI